MPWNVSRQHLQKACKPQMAAKGLGNGNYAELPHYPQVHADGKRGDSWPNARIHSTANMDNLAGLIGIWYNRQILRNDVNRVLFIFTY